MLIRDGAVYFGGRGWSAVDGAVERTERVRRTGLVLTTATGRAGNDGALTFLTRGRGTQ